MWSWHLQRCRPRGLWKLCHTSLGQAPHQQLKPRVTFNSHHHSRQWGSSPLCTDEDSEAQGGSDFPKDTQLTWSMLGPDPGTSLNNLWAQVQNENAGPLVQISRQRQKSIKAIRRPPELRALSDSTGYTPLKPAPWAPMCSDSRPKARLLPLKGLRHQTVVLTLETYVRITWEAC